MDSTLSRRVLDPDLQMGRAGVSGGHPDPEKTGGEVSKKIFSVFFLTFGSHQVGLKITRGGGWGGPPQDPPGTFLAIDPTQRIFHICK